MSSSSDNLSSSRTSGDSRSYDAVYSAGQEPDAKNQQGTIKRGSENRIFGRNITDKTGSSSHTNSPLSPDSPIMKQAFRGETFLGPHRTRNVSRIDSGRDTDKLRQAVEQSERRNALRLSRPIQRIWERGTASTDAPALSEDFQHTQEARRSNQLNKPQQHPLQHYSPLLGRRFNTRRTPRSQSSPVHTTSSDKDVPTSDSKSTATHSNQVMGEEKFLEISADYKKRLEEIKKTKEGLPKGKTLPPKEEATLKTSTCLQILLERSKGNIIQKLKAIDENHGIDDIRDTKQVGKLLESKVHDKPEEIKAFLSSYISNPMVKREISKNPKVGAPLGSVCFKLGLLDEYKKLIFSFRLNQVSEEHNIEDIKAPEANENISNFLSEHSERKPNEVKACLQAFFSLKPEVLNNPNDAKCFLELCSKHDLLEEYQEMKVISQLKDIDPNYYIEDLSNIPTVIVFLRDSIKNNPKVKKTDNNTISSIKSTSVNNPKKNVKSRERELDELKKIAVKTCLQNYLSIPKIKQKLTDPKMVNRALTDLATQTGLLVEFSEINAIKILHDQLDKIDAKNEIKLLYNTEAVASFLSNEKSMKKPKRVKEFLNSYLAIPEIRKKLLTPPQFSRGLIELATEHKILDQFKEIHANKLLNEIKVNHGILDLLDVEKIEEFLNNLEHDQEKVKSFLKLYITLPPVYDKIFEGNWDTGMKYLALCEKHDLGEEYKVSSELALKEKEVKPKTSQEVQGMPQNEQTKSKPSFDLHKIAAGMPMFGGAKNVSSFLLDIIHGSLQQDPSTINHDQIHILRLFVKEYLKLPVVLLQIKSDENLQSAFEEICNRLEIKEAYSDPIEKSEDDEVQITLTDEKLLDEEGNTKNLNSLITDMRNGKNKTEIATHLFNNYNKQLSDILYETIPNTTDVEIVSPLKEKMITLFDQYTKLMRTVILECKSEEEIQNVFSTMDEMAKQAISQEHYEMQQSLHNVLESQSIVRLIKKPQDPESDRKLTNKASISPEKKSLPGIVVLPQKLMTAWENTPGTNAEVYKPKEAFGVSWKLVNDLVKGENKNDFDKAEIFGTLITPRLNGWLRTIWHLDKNNDSVEEIMQFKTLSEADELKRSQELLPKLPKKEETQEGATTTKKSKPTKGK